ncbi:diacylglycerol/polyprenol kinase family protein [Chloroflexota bacterium]
MNPFLAFVLTFIISLAFLRTMDLAAHRGWIESKLSRKIIHIGTGPIFVLCWLMFPDVWFSRWLASLVPFAITAQFAMVGLGWIKDEASVKALSRTGDRREILLGPLFYGLIFVILTLVFWKDSPIGIIALMLMCGGDGLADILGRRVRSLELPWNKGKTMVGSLGMFIGGWVLSVLVLWIYLSVGVLNGVIGVYLLPITVIALIGMVIESLPLRNIDNITITLSAVLLGLYFFG